MERDVIAHLPSCEDGNCPTLFRERDTGNIWVRGLLADGTEGDVMIPAGEWAHLVAQLPK